MPTLDELGQDVMSTTGFTVAYYSALEKKEKTFSYTFNGTTIEWPVNTTRRCGMTVATLLAALQLIHGDETSYDHAFMVYVVHMASLSLHQMGKWLCGKQNLLGGAISITCEHGRVFTFSSGFAIGHGT